ncbi:MAG: YecA family protein [Moraxellaceae bacterium]|nr:YecA family protein [Moraxellaceae bacterium]
MSTAYTEEQLFEFLNSDDNQFGLDAIATHGFLTATVVGKPLPNWLDLMFEGNSDKIDDAIKQALIEWQEDLLNQLKNEQPINLPFVSHVEDEDDMEEFSLYSDVSIWSIGFIDAMYADVENDWFADEATEEDVAMLTLPMVVLSGVDEEDEADIDADEEDETLQELREDKEMLAQMVNSIENNLTELFLLFHTED